MSVIRNAVNILYYLFSPFKKMLGLYLLAVIALAGLTAPPVRIIGASRPPLVTDLSPFSTIVPHPLPACVARDLL